MKPIERKQIQIIKIAQKELDIDNDSYREMLHSHFKVKSCTKLNYFQANGMIALLKEKGFKIKPAKKPAGRKACGRLKDRDTGKQKASRPRQAGNMVRLASQAELQKIEVLSWLIHWRVKDGFTRWMSKRFSIERVRTAQEAYRVIEGLKKMFENTMKAQYGDNWASIVGDDPAIRRYIKEHIR
jgi:Bacteriophage Mu, GemA protein